MINRIKKYLLPSGQGNMQVDTDAEHIFELKHDDLLIGTLTYGKGTWRFSYSDAYKTDEHAVPLANFPTLEKEYTSLELWPFFASRIPSLSRKRILNQVKKHGINPNDLIGLLKFFGYRTIANPFVLQPQE